MKTTVKIFRYYEEIDAFTVTDEFKELSKTLGLVEWHHAVWIGRLFIMDNDFGEHWVDNWDERERILDDLDRLGLDQSEVFVIAPEKFADGKDGPCNTPETRKIFWTDVLRSLELSYELIFAKARQFNQWAKDNLDQDYIPDLEIRIIKIQSSL